jgi:transposase
VNHFRKFSPNGKRLERKLDFVRSTYYDVVCGILDVLKGGCQWRMLPGDLAKWRTVHESCRIGRQPGPDGGRSLWEKLLAELVGEVRQEDGRNEKTSMIIVDSQRVKNTATADETGFAGGKNVKGIKRLVVALHRLKPLVQYPLFIRWLVLPNKRVPRIDESNVVL